MDNTAYSGNQTHGGSNPDNAGGGSDDVHDVFAAATRADGVPMRVERADRNGNTRLQTELLRPVRRKPACEVIRSGEFTVDFFAHSSEEWIYLDEKILRRQAAERSAAHPFVPHGADAALHLLGVGDAAKRCADHVAMFKRRDEFSDIRGIVAKPVKEFRESTFRGIHAARPVDRG